MAIKLKNKLLTLLLAILIAGGMLFTARGINLQNDLMFNQEFVFDDMVRAVFLKDYLTDFDEETLTLENISDEQISDYRYRFGSLEDQVKDVTEQYKKPIADEKDDKQVEKLTAERDSKIADLVSNFTDANIVKQKIVTDTTKAILAQKENVLAELESMTEQLDEDYYYYLKSSDGQIFKNINNVSSTMKAPQIKAELEKEGEGSATAIEISVSPNDLYDYTTDFNLLDFTGQSLKGYYTYVAGSQGEQNHLDQLARERNWKIWLGTGLAMFVAAIILFSFYLRRDFDNPKLGRWLQRLPIDLRLAIIVCCTLVGLAVTLSFVRELVLLFIIMVLAIPPLLVFLPLLKDLWFTLTGKYNYPSLKQQLNNSFTTKTGKKLAKWFLRLNVGLQFVALIVMGIGIMFILILFLNVLRYYDYMSLFQLLVQLVALYLLAIFASFVINVLLDIAEARRLLVKPAQTMSVFKKETVSADSLVEIADSLAEMEKIVLNSQAHHIRNEELKTELLTNVSHDLRTPLTSIITYGDLLTKDDLTEENRQEYTKIINQKALRMKQLINDLFEVTKMNNGEIELNKSLLNLGQLLQQTVAEYGEEFEKADLKMLYTKPEKAVMVQLDGDRIWRVFDNLIGNVVKYALPHTRVYLKLSEAEEYLTIELKNISRYELNEEADNLMERFSRGDEARNTEGSGLGLAIAHSIISLHGGDVSIDVDGDLFKIRLTLPKE